MTGILKITSLIEAPGYIHPSQSDANRYNANRFLSRSYIAKCFHVEGTINGRKVRFTSPTVLFTKTTGMLNHIIVHNKSGWFGIEDGEITEHRGHAMFDGGSTPNVAINCHSKIVPLVSVGDEINISYSIKSKGTALPIDILWRVKILSKS